MSTGHIKNVNNRNSITAGMRVKFLQGTVAIYQFEHKTGLVGDDKIFTVTKIDGLWCDLFWMDQKSKQVITYQTLMTNMKSVENAPCTSMITETTNEAGAVMKLCKRIKRKVMHKDNNEEAQRPAAPRPAARRSVNCHKPDGIRLVCTRSRIRASTL